jgi:hypothetical protein
MLADAPGQRRRRRSRRDARRARGRVAASTPAGRSRGARLRARRPTVDELRTAWRARGPGRAPRRGGARFHSAALRLTAEETVIHVARAYERLRATVVADHGAVVAGTSVRTAGALVVDVGAQDGFDVVPLTPPPVADTVESTVVTSVEVADEATAVTGPAAGGARLDAAGAAGSDLGHRPARRRQRAAGPGPRARRPARRAAGRTPRRRRRSGSSSICRRRRPRPRPITARPPAPPVTTVEQSLRLARSGPGDRFVRAIRERLVDDDAAGAASLATAAAQVYPRDRRLAALCEIAAAQAAVTRGDRAAAIAATRAAIAARPPTATRPGGCSPPSSRGAALESGLIGEAYR